MISSKIYNLKVNFVEIVYYNDEFKPKLILLFIQEIERKGSSF